MVGRLHNSHIIPKFMLKLSKDKRTGRAVVFQDDGRPPREGQFDWKEKMFCSACEKRFKFYEDYMNETFFLHRKNAILSDSDSSVIYRGDNNLMAISLLSVFWRAVESNLPEFRFMVLPDYMVPAMREWILMRQIPINWQNALTIKLSKIIGPGGEAVRFVITPRVRQYPAKFEFIFAFGGYFVEFILPPDPSKALGRFVLRQGSSLIRVQKIHYSLIPEIFRILQR